MSNAEPGSAGPPNVDPDNQSANAHDPNQLADFALRLRCEHCNAGPGAWCVTATGRRAPHLHATRLLIVQTCYLLGYERGRTGATP